MEHGGKRTYLPGAHGSPESISAYKQFIRETCGGAAVTDPSRPKPEGISALIELWLAHAEIYYGGQGAYENTLHSLKPLLHQFGATPVERFGPLKLKELQQILLAQDRSREYINRTTAHVKRMFRWALSEELVSAAICQGIASVPGVRKGRTSARESEPRLPVAWHDVLPVLSHVSETVRTMILCEWHTGVRPQSVCLAKPEQFDTSVIPWMWKPRHKMEYAGQSLTVFVGPQVRKLLADRLEATAPSDYLFKPEAARRNRRYGKFYRRNSYAQAIARGIERANAQRRVENELLPEGQRKPLIPHWTPHQLRHAKATAVRAKHGIEAAQAMLGHSSIEASQIYAQRQAGVARKIAEEEG